MLDIQVVGLADQAIPFPEALALQRRVHSETVAETRGDTVLLLEHPSVYTAGSRTAPSERPVDGSPVLDVDRGGKITWHGPGQLVGYPIVRLGEPADVVSYVRRLEEMLIVVAAHFGVVGRRVEGRSGVWVGASGRESKVAAIGVRVASGVTMHGFSLNCDNSLDAYRHIVACGIRDAGVTTLSLESGSTITTAEAAVAVREHFEAIVMTDGRRDMRAPALAVNA